MAEHTHPRTEPVPSCPRCREEHNVTPIKPVYSLTASGVSADY